MGKTTLMHMIETRLQEYRPHDPPVPTVWFNAWAYDEIEPLWVALALAILRRSREEFDLRRRAILFYELNRESLKIRKAVRSFLKLLLLGIGVLLVAIVGVRLVLRTADVQLTAEQTWRYIGLLGGLGVIATLYNTIGKDVYKRISSPFKRRVTKQSELNLAEVSQAQDIEERIASIAQFERDYNRVIRAATDYGRRPLVVFIDELDRLAPPKMVKLLETMTLKLRAVDCIFVLGINGQVVANSLGAQFKDLRPYLADPDESEWTIGQRMLESVIEIRFVIPSAGISPFDAFVGRNLQVDSHRDVKEIRDKVIQAERLIEGQQKRGETLNEAAKSIQAESENPAAAVSEAKVEIRARSFGDSEDVRQAMAAAVPYLGYNPRKVKRFINLFKLQALIANRRGLLDDGTIHLEQLAKWLIISTRWPTVIEGTVSDPDFIEHLMQAHDVQDHLDAIEDPSARDVASRSRLDPLLVDPRIKQLYKSEELIRLLKDLALNSSDSPP
jgi:hypothetical protein